LTSNDQTRIVINVFREKHHYNRQQIPATAANPRIYEATACGALVVSEWRPELDTLCPEMPNFRTVDECVSLVGGLVADPDRAAGMQAQCAARLAPHTYASRLQAVLQACGLAVAA
jgi:spore maturation protein CgeB